MKKTNLPHILLVLALLCSVSLVAQNDDSDDPSDENPVELSTFEVVSSADDGWKANLTLSATRINTPIKELPMNIFSITEEQMDNFSIDTIYEALGALTAGVAPEDAGDPRGNRRITLRGFNIEEVLKNNFGIENPTDTYNVARIDIVKGPAGMVNNITPPGGSINYFTKIPNLSKTFGSLRFRTGSYDFYRGNVDINTKVNDNVAFRLNAVMEDWDTFQNFSKIQRTAINPVILIRPFENTSILAEYEHSDFDRPVQRTQTIQFRPSGTRDRLPLWLVNPDLGITREFAYQGPEGRQVEVLDSWRVEATHSFGARTKLNLGFLSQKEKRDRVIFAHGFRFNRDEGNDPNALPTTTNLNPQVQFRGRDFDQFKIQLVQDFNIGESSHRFLVGARLQDGVQQIRNWEERLIDADGNRAGLYTFDVPLFNGLEVVRPSDRPSVLFFRTGRNRNFDRGSDQEAYFASIHSKFFNENLIISLGYQKFDLTQETTFVTTFNSDGTPVVETSFNDKAAPFFGALYQLLDKKLGIYGQYSESLQPNFAVDNEGVPFGPLIAEGWEVGLKWEFFDGKFSGTASFYEILQTNIPTTISDENNEPIVVRIDGAQSEGFEIDTFITPLPNWIIQIGYNYNDSFIKDDPNSANIGNQLLRTFNHAIVLSSRYNFTKDLLKGISVGMNYNYTGDKLDRTENVAGGVGRTPVFDNPSNLLGAFISYTGKWGEYDYMIKLDGKNLLKNPLPIGYRYDGAERFTTLEMVIPAEFYLTFEVKF